MTTVPLPPQVLSVLMKQTRDDTDLTEDVEFLHEKLNNYLQDLRQGEGLHCV